jgi:rieske iron-sulfur protein
MLPMLRGRSAQAAVEPANMLTQVGDQLTYHQRSRRGPSLTLSDIKLKSKQLLVLPKDPATGIVREGDRRNQILLQRFPMDELSEQTRAISADGLVAYTAVCTHDGCPVTAWDRNASTYMCPCHQSEFDPKNMGTLVVGPAYRPLPALPLALDEEGVITVAGDYTAPVGHGTNVSGA